MRFAPPINRPTAIIDPTVKQIMPTEPNKRQSHLFTLRLWTEDMEDEEVEWRGRLHHVATDEVRYFRDWPSLIPMLLNMLRDAEKDELAKLLSSVEKDEAEG